MKRAHILVVEDHEQLAHSMGRFLTNEGYSVDILFRGDMVWPSIKNRMPDLILLDINLPGKDGLELLNEIREGSDVSVIMVTARIDEGDRLSGFGKGADDYICKPFNLKELVARVKAVLKRSGISEQKEICFELLTLSPASRTLQVDESEVALTRSEFDILYLLVSSPERVYSRSELIANVMGDDYEGADRIIDSHIKNLRRKISQITGDKQYIISVYGVGYRLKKG